MKVDGIGEARTECHAAIDYDYEHRFAEYEHGFKRDTEPGGIPELSHATALAVGAISTTTLFAPAL